MLTLQMTRQVRRQVPGLIAIGSLIALGAFTQTALHAGATGGVANVYFQAIDSCQQALGGGVYALQGGSYSSPLFEAPPDHAPATVSSSGTCPIQQGNCATFTVGCVIFPDVAPGTYTIKYSRSAPPTTFNTGGYAACTGGSACQSEVADVTVNNDGSVSAKTTNVSPDGSALTWPNQIGHTAYAGTAADPVVFHTFGIGTGSCDGDGDADDRLTGTPSSHCAYPETQEASACQPFPWSCTIVTPPPYQITTYYDSVAAAGSLSHYQKTVATGDFTATVKWAAGGQLGLTVYNTSGTVLKAVTGTSGTLTIDAGTLATATYKVKINNYSSSAVATTLVVDHSGQSPTPTPTATATATVTPSPTVTVSPTPTPTSSGSTTYYDTVAALSSLSHFQKTATSGDFTAMLTWSGGGELGLTIYDPSGSVIQAGRNTSGRIAIDAGVLPAATYKVKINNYSSAAVPTTLIINHH